MVLLLSLYHCRTMFSDTQRQRKRKRDSTDISLSVLGAEGLNLDPVYDPPQPSLFQLPSRLSLGLGAHMMNPCSWWSLCLLFFPLLFNRIDTHSTASFLMKLLPKTGNWGLEPGILHKVTRVPPPSPPHSSLFSEHLLCCWSCHRML